MAAPSRGLGVGTGAAEDRDDILHILAASSPTTASARLTGAVDQWAVPLDEASRRLVAKPVGVFAGERTLLEEEVTQLGDYRPRTRTA